MSAEVRQELAEAASSVEGLTGSPYFVQTTTPGTVLVRLDRIDFPNNFGGVAFWSLVLIGPQDIAASETYFAEKVPALREALAPHLAVTAMTPELIDLGLGPSPCAVLTGHRED